MACCCVNACFACLRKEKMSPRGHIRRTTTMKDILLGVGMQYAFCRQCIFLTNALLIGSGMAIIAAGWQRSDNALSLWLGDSWAQTQIALGGGVLFTTLLGCLGSCYQNRMALLLL